MGRVLLSFRGVCIFLVAAGSVPLGQTMQTTYNPLQRRFQFYCRPSLCVASVRGWRCWCSQYQSCVAWAEFLTDARELAVVGPHASARTCVSGQPCRVEGLTGIGLSDNDQLIVLDTCGVSSSVRLHGIQQILTDLI